MSDWYYYKIKYRFVENKLQYAYKLKYKNNAHGIKADIKSSKDKEWDVGQETGWYIDFRK